MTPQRKALLVGGLALGALLVAGVGIALADASRSTSDTHGLPWSPLARDAWGRGGGFTEANGTVSGRGVSFLVDPATGTLTNVDAAGANNTTVRLADRVTVTPATATTNAEEIRGGAYVLTLGDAARLVVAEGPGAFSVRATNDTTVTIALPDGATVAVHEAVADWSPAGATIDYGSEKANLVLSDGATVTRDANVLTVRLAAGQDLAVHVLGAHDCPHGGMMHDGHGFGGPGLGRRGARPYHAFPVRR